jgi:ADP-ribose pyrophosphatase YjhB (NUDIX family)
MNMERSDVTFVVRVAAAICDENGRVLVIRESTFGSEQWKLPGGALRLGESLAEALEREIREETGYRAEAGDVVCVVERIIDRFGERGIELCFAASVKGKGEPVRRPGERISNVAWIASDVLSHGLDVAVDVRAALAGGSAPLISDR